MTDEGKNEQWYTNKELYEMFQREFAEVKEQWHELNTELGLTAQAIKKYNGLIESMSKLHERVTVLETQSRRSDREEEMDLQIQTRNLKRWTLVIAALALLNIVSPLIAAIL